MCLAIVAPPGKRIPEDHIRNGCFSQRDGFGMAFVKNGKVVVDKGYFEFHDFLKAYNSAFDANQGSHFLVHMRTSTMGKRNGDNTHPFVGKFGAMIHNGHVGGLGDREISDTHHLAKILHDVPPRAVPYLVNSLTTKAGYNKFAFLTPENKVFFTMPGSWVTDGEISYSNGCYKSRATDYGGRPVQHNPHYSGGDGSSAIWNDYHGD